jgi:peptidyl-prolyl cis-trans isomerase SurA
MQRCIQFAGLLFLLLSGQPLFAGQVIERIVATVNGEAILQSEWEEAARYECLLNQRTVSTLMQKDLADVLDRLVDQHLIEQQMQSAAANPISTQELSRKMQELREQVAGQGQSKSAGGSEDEAAWQRALQQYGLEETTVQRRLELQVTILHFIDTRFRAGVHIEDAEIERYYTEQFEPELHRRGGTLPPLAQVTAQIREILTQQTINQRFSAWLNSLRAQASIEVR